MEMRLKRKTRLKFQLNADGEELRKTFRKLHPGRDEVLTASDRWIEFITKGLWRSIRFILRNRFPRPGIGGEFAINLAQLMLLTELSWGEARCLISCGEITTIETGTGRHRDTSYILLEKLPHLANYLVVLHRDGQLTGRHWHHIFRKTKTNQPFEQVPLEEAVQKLEETI